MLHTANQRKRRVRVRVSRFLLVMPALPKRPCSGPGCPNLVEYGKCPECQSKAKQREARMQTLVRKTTAERGYGADYRSLRLPCFQRDQWKCVDCGWEPDIVRMAREAGFPVPSEVILDELRRAFHRRERHLHADHEIPIEERPDLRLSLGNLRTRCNVCHNAKTAREDGGFGNPGHGCDAYGLRIA